MPGHLGAPMPLEAMGSGAAQLGVATRPPVQHHRATLPLAPPLQWWGAVVLKKVEGKKDAAGRDVFTLRCCCPLGPLPSFRARALPCPGLPGPLADPQTPWPCCSYDAEEGFESDEQDVSFVDNRESCRGA